LKLVARTILIGSIAFFVLWAPALVAGRWSGYGPWFTGAVGWAAQWAAPSQHIVFIGTIVFTPRAIVRVAVGCDGFAGIRTFSILCGLVVLLNYRRMSAWRFCGLYISGVLLLWMHNAARVVRAVVAGGETHYGTSEMMVVALALGLALVAFRKPGRAKPMDGMAGSATTDSWQSA
jgi:hypothetical protein